MRIVFAYYENEEKELIREEHMLDDSDEKSEETATDEAVAASKMDGTAEKTEETAATDKAEYKDADSKEESKKEQLKPVIIVEPIRYISRETHKEKIVLNLYKNWTEPKDIINSIPYASIETDILNLRNSLPQINIYGTGFMATDVAKLRMLIEQRYRDFPIEYDDSQSIKSFIKDIALELYNECSKKDNGTFPKKNGLYYVPVSIFNEIFEELYGTKELKIDNNFDNRTVRSEMKRHNLIKCNTVENSYYSRISGHGAKYIVFVINK